MPTPNINSATGAASAAANDAKATSLALQQSGVTTNSAKELNNRFIKLLVAQMRNQDPLNPLSNAELTSQLAQISTVEGLENLRSTMLAISGQINIAQAMNASSLIGKGVLVPGTKIALGGDQQDPQREATPAGVKLGADAAKVEVKIADKDGNVVRTFDLGLQRAGILSVNWDGMDDNGQPVAPGAYHLAVKAADADGKALSAEALTFGKVGSVAYAGAEPKLDLGLAGQFTLSNINKVLGS